DWARAQGLTITHRYPNRLLVDVEAPAAAIEKAFNVTLNVYTNNTKVFFANDRDPEIPASLSAIVHSVSGLNSLQQMQPATQNADETVTPDYSPGPAVAKAGAGRANGDRSKLPRMQQNS